MKEILKRISSMRSCARKDGKYVPSVDEIIFSWPNDMTCPRCKKTMVLSSKISWHLCVTLQHIKEPGEGEKFVLCCMSCNAACRNLGDGDGTINTPCTSRMCKICNEIKEVTEFILINNKSGNKTRTSYCNQCRKNKDKENRTIYKEKRNETKRISYAKNREKELSRKKRYYLENKDNILKKAKEKNSIKPPNEPS